MPLNAVAQMKAEPMPTPTIAPTTNPTTSLSNSPQTGDSSNALPFALVALCSAAGFIFLMVRKKAK